MNKSQSHGRNDQFYSVSTCVRRKIAKWKGRPVWKCFC